MAIVPGAGLADSRLLIFWRCDWSSCDSGARRWGLGA